MVGNITIFKDNLAFGISLAFKLTYDLVDDIVIESLEVMKVTDHLLTEDHVLIIIIFQNLLEELFDYVRKVFFQGLNIFLTKISTSAVTF